MAVKRVMKNTNPFETAVCYLCLRFLLFPAACYHAGQCGTFSEWGGDLWFTGVIMLFTVAQNSMGKHNYSCDLQ